MIVIEINNTFRAAVLTTNRVNNPTFIKDFFSHRVYRNKRRSFIIVLNCIHYFSSKIFSILKKKSAYQM